MDIHLFYREAGTGEPLLLLHGNGESGEYFARQAGPFSSRYRLLIPDTRGHGRSPRGEAPFTLSQFAEDLRLFMEERGVERAHILGFSDGGNIALTFALRWPERVNKLILNGANVFPEGLRRRVLRPMEEEYRRLLCRESDAESRRRAELLALMVNEPQIRPEALHKLTMPVLVLAGRRDLIRQDHSRLIAGNFPRGELALLPGDHFLAAREPESFNRCVLEFLARD